MTCNFLACLKILPSHKGVCKNLRELLDAMLLLGNMLMMYKNTTHLCYVMLGLVKLEPDMSYDTQVRLSKMCTRFIVTKHARVLQLQNAYALWRSKTRTRYGEAKRAHIMEKQNTHTFWRSKTRMHFREAKRARVMENHKKWFQCMAREMNKNNSLHHQDLGPIVIFQHHQAQHFKQPCLTSQQYNFSWCCNVDAIRRF